MSAAAKVLILVVLSQSAMAQSQSCSREYLEIVSRIESAPDVGLAGWMEYVFPYNQRIEQNPRATWWAPSVLLISPFLLAEAATASLAKQKLEVEYRALATILNDNPGADAWKESTVTLYKQIPVVVKLPEFREFLLEIRDNHENDFFCKADAQGRWLVYQYGGIVYNVTQELVNRGYKIIRDNR